MSKLLIQFSLIDAFDAWLVKHRYIQAGGTVFGPSISDKVPEWIAVWILDEWVKYIFMLS
jgi:hypothetical protein